MNKNSLRFLILNIAALAAFGLYEAKRKIIVLPPVYVYVRVPAAGVRMSDYERGCLAALTRAGAINAANREALETKARQ